MPTLQIPAPLPPPKSPEVLRGVFGGTEGGPGHNTSPILPRAPRFSPSNRHIWLGGRSAPPYMLVEGH